MQISLGFALAMIAGLTPLWSVHNLLVVFLLLVLRTNIGAFVFAWAIFTGVAYIFDPWFNDLGAWVLHYPGLQGLWTEWYNSPFWRITRFNNTLVMGSVVISLLMFVPMLLLGNLLIHKYRTQFLEYWNNSRWAKLIKSKWFSKAVELAE
jgi:uncharacterized protein (TIGR03546 family)